MGSPLSWIGYGTADLDLADDVDAKRRGWGFISSSSLESIKSTRADLDDEAFDGLVTLE